MNPRQSPRSLGICTYVRRSSTLQDDAQLARQKLALTRPTYFRASCDRQRRSQ